MAKVGWGAASVETSPSAVEDHKSSTLSRGKHLPVYWPYMEEKKLKQTEGKQFSPIKERRYLYVELLHSLHIAVGDLRFNSVSWNAILKKLCALHQVLKTPGFVMFK